MLHNHIAQLALLKKTFSKKNPYYMTIGDKLGICLPTFLKEMGVTKFKKIKKLR